MNYIISDLDKIQTYLNFKLGKIGEAFLNAKKYFTKNLESKRIESSKGIMFDILLTKLKDYNYLSYPGYSSVDTTGDITLGGTVYNGIDINTLLMYRVGDKIRYKVTYSQTIDDETTVLSVKYVDIDPSVANNCQVSCENKTDLINRISVYSNPIK